MVYRRQFSQNSFIIDVSRVPIYVSAGSLGFEQNILAKLEVVPLLRTEETFPLTFFMQHSPNLI